MYDNESETIIHEQKRIKFKPRIKLSHNIDDHIICIQKRREKKPSWIKLQQDH